MYKSKTYLFFLFFLTLIKVCGQTIEGKVTFVNSSSNVYVRFENANGILVDDTLSVLFDKNWEKVLIVKTISSKSILTSSLSKKTITIGQKVRAHIITEINAEVPELIEKIKVVSPSNIKIESRAPEKVEDIHQSYRGRISVSTNGTLKDDYSRIRTAFAFNIDNINDGKFSFSNYITYRKRMGNDLSQSGFNDDFKVYDLALSYQANKKTLISIGRKLNLHMANMGAIDGIQAEHTFNKFSIGAFTGTRPDYLDYSYNISLFQVGGFIAHESETKHGISQTSIAFAEQLNKRKIDRRFMYLQHSSTPVKNLYLFYSIELDLFQNIDSVKSNKVNLTSTYFSLRYRPFKKLRLSASYDNRRNIIYYETYRSYIDQLIEQETRQGLRFSANYRALKTVSLNLASFYRYQHGRPVPTKNYVASLNFSRLQGLGVSANFNLNKMQTYYFDGIIYGTRMNKDLFKGRVMLEGNYRKVNYLFSINENQELIQDVIGFSTNFYSRKGTSLMLSYEGTFEGVNKYNRYFITFAQRFKSKNNNLNKNL